MVDAVITDPPYSAKVHEGHDAGAARTWDVRPKKRDGSFDTGRQRRAISYARWTPDDVADFVAAWAPRCQGWFVAMSDSDLCGAWRSSFEAHGLTGFQPLPCLMPGMTVRMCGDGPSSWAVYANVARPKALSKWGTLPGGYHGPNGNGASRRDACIGGKPEWLMRALVRDYTKPGDLVCDPCAGGATTLLAAVTEGRRAVGSEMDPETYRKARARLERGHTPDLFARIG